MALLRRRFVVLCMLLWAGAALAQNAPLERQVKAAFLYKFASYVEWPEGSFAHPDSALLIGVAGNDALAGELEQMVAGRSAGGHPLAVRRLHAGEAPAGLHVLFIGALDAAAAAHLLAQAQSQATLTVTDGADGGMIHFVQDEERLRFEVALKPVLAARLRISARMLAAARKVLPS